VFLARSVVGWLEGGGHCPDLLALVPARKVKERTVSDGLSGTWLHDCGPNLGEAALAEFFILWQMLAVVRLSLEQEDRMRWCWLEDGVYSSKSAYKAFFAGRPQATTTSVIWHSRAPYGCKFFCVDCV
jgi:hypothetical protein